MHLFLICASPAPASSFISRHSPKIQSQKLSLALLLATAHIQMQKFQIENCQVLTLINIAPLTQCCFVNLKKFLHAAFNCLNSFTSIKLYLVWYVLTKSHSSYFVHCSVNVTPLSPLKPRFSFVCCVKSKLNYEI